MLPTCPQAVSKLPEIEVARPATDSYAFDHPSDSPWWISGQLNVIYQHHGPFHADYSGPNSFSAEEEDATSVLATLYSAVAISDRTEFLLDVELAGGRGLSDALGLGGFTNLDVVRNPDLGDTPYLARAEIHHVIPLSPETIAVERGPLSSFSTLPQRRVELHAGKLSTVDFFDQNSVGSDSHRQFLNWAVDNNGAFDYAADTRGYTLGAVVEYQEVEWGVRLGEMLMPTVANGIEYDYDVAHARGENLEVEHRHEAFGRPGAVRLLAYLNHANMGSYREAIDAFESGQDPTPDITAHREPGRTKYGLGLNLEQEVSATVRVFGRAGWNDGANESFAYTEVDDTLVAGFDCAGIPWGRPQDKVGLALASNGLSSDHKTYLELGGKGFLLGDGALNYGRESILESYYTASLGHGIFPAVDLQFIENPGYNRDRGPAFVLGVRMQVAF
jgi:hypothetical protein